MTFKTFGQLVNIKYIFIFILNMFYFYYVFISILLITNKVGYLYGEFIAQFSFFPRNSWICFLLYIHIICIYAYSWIYIYLIMC